MSKPVKVLAIDPSLTQSGWALFEAGRRNVLAWGTVKSISPKEPLSLRLKDLQEKVDTLLQNLQITKNDFLVCEGPAPISLNPSSSIKVEQVRGIFETLARERGLTVLGRLNPRTVQNELLGLRGKQIPRNEVKRVARQVLLQIFPKLCEEDRQVEQDVIDAMLIGILAEARISHCLKTGLNPIFSFEKQNGAKRSKGRGLNWSENYFVRK